MRQRLYVAGVLGAFVLLAALGVAVLQYGRFDPSPPSLAKEPNPAIPGRIAYLDTDGCIAVVQASGASREQLYCFASVPGPFIPASWEDADTIAFLDTTISPERGPLSGPPQYEVLRLDVRTRQVQRTGEHIAADRAYPGGGSAAVSPSGEAVMTNEDGEVYLVKDGRRTKIAEFDVAEYRGPHAVAWSPDGNWILLRYYPRDSGQGSELWVLSRDGQTKGTLVTDAGGLPGVSWWIDGVGAWPRKE